MKKTLGGDRLGSGKKLKVELHGYERSTHDMGYVFRSTMSAGTLVPFLKEVALPGDTFDINLNADIKTHPTIGPLFGSYKAQLDIFICPLRLYQGKLHNNKLGIGMVMNTIKLPLIELNAPTTNGVDLTGVDIDNMQINPSSIFAYLGMRGIGTNRAIGTGQNRYFNAVPWLAYWDIYKNYYSNKQEELGAVIHTGVLAENEDVINVDVNGITISQNGPVLTGNIGNNGTSIIVNSNVGNYQNPSTIMIAIKVGSTTSLYPLDSIATEVSYDAGTGVQIYEYNWSLGTVSVQYWAYKWDVQTPTIDIKTFDLDRLDEMREKLLADVLNPNAYTIGVGEIDPYGLPLEISLSGIRSILASQEGLALKTYNSDLLNNWLSTEWIDGVGGISEITAVDTTGGSFTMDTLALSKKVYDMLNRIAVSGGTYDDWLDAVYTHDRYTRVETPVYMGGLIKELVFQEVVSNSAVESENGSAPLGTLAGKGVMGNKHKGGQVTIKVDEPAYIMGIISLTPRLDYSQGNDWDTHLLTMDDLHKPALDEIGFQELITEQMAWWDTSFEAGGWTTKSAGKQPAWINYMTNINRVRGNFAIKDNEMFMTLNRSYTPDISNTAITIQDLTTYIDPRKFNQIFADTALDAQNFWVQVGVDMTVRRKLSAKVMPNL